MGSLDWNHAEFLAPYKEQAAFQQSLSAFFREKLPKRGYEQLGEERRDTIGAVVFDKEVDTIVEKCCNARGLSLVKIFDGETDRQDIRNATDAIPWLDCAISLQSSIHRDLTHAWKKNDVIDIKFLTTTIPYCDVVTTDREVKKHASQCRLPERYKTVVLAKLRDLEDVL